MFFHPIFFESVLVATAVLLLAFEAMWPIQNKRRVGYALAGLILFLLVYSFCPEANVTQDFGTLYHYDGFSLYFKRLILLSSAFVMLLSADYWAERTEHFILLLIATAGMLTVTSSVDFILLFVALELVTICFYVLVCLNKKASLFAGAKYLIMGAFSGGLLAYGIAYLFGATGSLHLNDLNNAISSPELHLGLLFVLGAFSFKLAAVPGHMWAPDVYQNAATPVSAFLSSASKAVGLLLIMRLIDLNFHHHATLWQPLFLVVCASTILYGNLAALQQKSSKRLLGCSSIAHAGYLLMALCAPSAFSWTAALFYLTQYAISALCLFAVIQIVEDKFGDDHLIRFAGLHQSSPFLATAFGLSILSLAGIPPLNGFFAKYLVFSALLQSAETSHLVVAGCAIIGVVIGLTYYFGLIRAAFVEKAETPQSFTLSPPLHLTLILCMLAMVILGIYQEPLLSLAEEATAVFGVK